MFIAALFRIAKTWKQLNCLSVGEWIKMWRTCIHTHTHTHAHKNIIQYKICGNPSICSNIDGP